MNNKKLVIFDWGGVIESHYDRNYPVSKAIVSLIRKYTNKYDNDEIIKIYSSCAFDENNIEIGTINKIDGIYAWINRLKEAFDFEATYDDFLENYKREHNKIYSYQNVVSFIKSIKVKCKIAILSNLMLIDKERIDKHVKLSDFDYVWLSFELELKKPDYKIYKKVEEDCGYEPKNILFIDDTKENIEEAKKRGWNTCMATGNDLNKIKQAVDNFLNM